MCQLDLTVKDCTVQNFEGKGMYITNGQKVTVEGCTFIDVGGSQETINYGDHAIDLCIGGVENAEIRIVGNTFVGMSGQNTCIQIQQRNPNGGTDDNPGDWWGFDVDTSIKIAYIAGNDFTQSESPADVRLGSWPKAGDERTFTKAFPATIVAETATKVVSCTELGGNGNNSPLQDMNVELNAGAEFSVDGAYDYEAKKTTLDYNLESGVATLSGYVPEYMTVNVADGAAVAIGLENHGTVNSIDGNVFGTPVDGDPVTDVTPRAGGPRHPRDGSDSGRPCRRAEERHHDLRRGHRRDRGDRAPRRHDRRQESLKPIAASGRLKHFDIFYCQKKRRPSSSIRLQTNMFVSFRTDMPRTASSLG